MTTRAPFRGTTLAGALLFDVRTIGDAEAQRRVLAAWQPDSALRELPDGRWLLTLPDGISLRAELAPGLPLVRQASGWSAPGHTSEPESVTYPQAGEIVTIPLAETREVDTQGWIDLSTLPRHRLTPLDRAPEVAQLPEPLLDTTSPDLREAAGVGLLSSNALSFRESLGVSPGGRWRGKPGPAGSEAAGPHRGPGLLPRLWSTLVWKSPAGAVLSRKQLRYLDELTRRFERREFDQALRDAIGLDGAAMASLASLRMPRPRTSLHPGSSTGGRSGFAGSSTAYERLKELYLEAARELERTGRLTEAAFVYADLLNDPRAAIDLLERNDRIYLAAELAEGQDLEPALVIRLWWQAGERARAVEVARSRGAFAVGIERLHAIDPEQARELRRAWIEYCRDAGDPVAAVDAAWPDAVLRPSVVSDIAAGMAMGGPRAAYLFAHLVTEHPTPDNLDKALALLASDDVEAQSRFTSALVGLRSTDRAQDKRLATAALRSLLRNGSTADQPVRRAVAVLRDRCDPLVRADLPHLRSRSSEPGSPVSITFDDQQGALPVHDAVALRGGALLVAHGDHGVRLLTHDGRTRTRWDLPVHQLVMADHGGKALLVTRARSLRTIHRLDLGTRTVRRWTTLPAWKLLPSYDGGTLTAINPDGFAFIDTLSEQPKTLWRELDSWHQILAVNRTPDCLTALAIVKPAVANQKTQLQLFSWELPSMTLRLRRILPPDELVALRQRRTDPSVPAVLPREAVIAGAEVTRYRQHDGADRRELKHHGLISSGNALGLLSYDRWTIEVGDRSVAELTFPEENPGLREHDGLITVWTPDGHLAVVDPVGPSLLADFRTRY